MADAASALDAWALMRALLDIAPAAMATGGTRTYTRQLAQALSPAAGDPQVATSALPPWLAPDGRRDLRHKLKVLAWDTYYYHLLLPGRARRADLLHVPSVRAPLWSPVPLVVTIFDMIPALYPQYFRRRDALIINRYTRWGARRAACVITISEQSRRDLARLLAIAPARVAVTHLAAGPEFRQQPSAAVAAVRERLGLAQPYILSVSTLEPRKNLERVLAAYAALRRAGTISQRLVLVGRRGWLEGPIFAAAQRLGVADAVIFTGSVEASDLPAVYAGADCFVYVPLYEGFGLPPLEAMACGCPVVTAASSSLPEVVGAAALQVDPTSSEQIAAAIATLLSDPALAADLRDRGLERAATFSWQRCAEETRAIYRRVIAAAR